MVGDWLRKKAAGLALAFMSVEKNALNQNGGQLTKKVSQERKVGQDSLLDALLQGEVNQEVKDLRWRTYKVLQASQNLVTKTEPIIENGEIVGFTTNTSKINKKDGLRRIILEPSDDYPLEMVFNAEEQVSTIYDNLNNNLIKEAGEGESFTATEGYVGDSKTIGIIDGAGYFATAAKGESPLQVYREAPAKFDIESYTKKLHVRTISETEKLLEFYISVYPNEYNRRTILLISDIKKAILNPRAASFLDIKEVGFLTNKTVGVEDFLIFQYDITGFDKIVEHNGFYVIKYKATVSINGENIVEKYKEEELERKYDNKEMRKMTV